MGVVALGRSRPLLPARGVAVRGRARLARSPRAAGRTPRRGGPRPGIAPGLGSGARPAGSHDGAAPAGHRPDRSRAVGGPRSRGARPRGQRRRAGPVDGLGGAPHRPARPQRVPGHGCVGRGAGRLARRRGEPRRRLGARAEARRRDRPRRARCGLPRGECADLQRRGRGPRAGAPTGRAVHPRLAGAARGARHRGRGSGAGPVERAGARRLGDAGAGGPPWGGPPLWNVLGGVRPPGPRRPRRPGRRDTRAIGVRLQPHRRRPPAGLPPLWRAGPVYALRRGRVQARATRRCCGARAAATRGRSSARPVVGCA